MSNTCPVCGKGEGELFVAGDLEVGSRYVSHLACVAQANEVMRVAVEAHGRLEAENDDLSRYRHLYEAESRVRKAMDKRAERAEAELTALKAERKRAHILIAAILLDHGPLTVSDKAMREIDDQWAFTWYSDHEGRHLKVEPPTREEGES